MEGRRKSLFILLGIFLAVILAAGWYLHSHDIAVLNPKGTIAAKQRHLIIVSTLLMLIVVVPVYIMTFAIAWKYREDNTKARYEPDWDHNLGLESLWWALPCAIILALAVLTYKSSNELDPFKPITSDVQPLTIQVVALQWRWLFIYPEQNIASVNLVRFPVNRPLNFQITSDAPMNSFWIPQLGGQIYAMSGMSAQLHLMATSVGNFSGSSANISGRGFADMNFGAQAVSNNDFSSWVSSVQKSPRYLSLTAYNRLSRPSTDTRVALYSSPQPKLYSSIILKFMEPGSKNNGVDYFVASAGGGLQ